MCFLWLQLGRFWHWVQEGGNSNIILVGITLIYVWLTGRIMKATTRQASGSLQPVLSLCRFAKSGDESFHTILIENKSDRPVVFLDVVISCHPMGHKAIVHNLRGWDDQILSTGDNARLKLDFSKELAALRIDISMCGFGADIVVSDLSRQVAIQYDFAWAVGRFACKVGMPFRVRWRYRLRPWGWRYHRVKSRFSST
jgi:hypothetical protein